MDPLVVAAIAGVVGVVVGSGIVVLVVSGRQRDVVFASERPMPESVVRLLDVLPQASIVVSTGGHVMHATEQARELGVVSGDRISNLEIESMVGAVVRTGDPVEREVQVMRRRSGRITVDTVVRAVQLSPVAILVLVLDLTDSRRIEAVRRDFVVNVSHELKTPVGALVVLAEAVEAASDDPDQVRHFARRMQIESARLSALVTDIIELSRLQGANPMEAPEAVAIDRIVGEAVDSARLAASAKDIEIIRGGTPGLTVLGEEAHLTAALRNLLTNAVAYSPEHTRVAVAVRASDDLVEVSVTDQGIGIAADDQERIFERFYRVDPARSRITGGTGLGLAIVKHVCASHGGDVTVWSTPGEGSTFTLRLPRLDAAQERAAS